MTNIRVAAPRVLLVGGGIMGSALSNGFAATYPDTAITIIDTDIISTSFRISPRANLQIADTPSNIADADVDLLVFAVKPQMLMSIVPDYGRFIRSGATPVSIAAGIKIEAIRAEVPADLPVIRAMPNLPAKTRDGVTALFGDGQLSPAIRRRAEMFFESVGEVLWVRNEPNLDAVTAISGSGPAYFFAFVDALARAGVEQGLPTDVAKKLARQTLLGAASLLRSRDVEPAELKRNVCSTGGTTEAALKILEGKNRLASLVSETVAAAHARARELSDLYG